MSFLDIVSSFDTAFDLQAREMNCDHKRAPYTYLRQATE